MNDLSIQLIIDPQCYLVALDNTRYYNLDTLPILNDLTKHVSLEFLVYNEDSEPITASIYLKEFKYKGDEYAQNISKFTFPSDGVYKYYKFIIPKLEWLIKEEEEIIEDENIIKHVARIRNEIFYYNNNFYFGLKDKTVDINNLSSIINNDNCIVINNILDIWNYILDNYASQSFSFQKEIFTYCKLKKCLVNLQRKTLLSLGTCNSNDDIYNRDFLLSALYVLDYLKDTNNYSEGQRIIEVLTTCGGFLCEENSSINNNCGCGTIKY